MTIETKIQPTIFVIMGVTGDLARSKLIPAIWHLYKKNLLPQEFRLIGFGRRPLSKIDFRNLINESLAKHEPDSMKLKNFLQKSLYIEGDFNQTKSYLKLGEILAGQDSKLKVCANKLFYLATPPSLYELILEKIDQSGLNVECMSGGWTRILIEKPFGRDLKTAQALDLKLGKLFKEKQIFRIDHYLAKETIRNIIAFRFANEIFEPVWNNKNVVRIEVILHEANDLSTRGNFYHDIGALRDVGQNHLLQMLASVIMDRPKNNSSESIRDSRAKILGKLALSKTVRPIRGQYEGFTTEAGVPTESDTETYFKIVAKVDSPRWRGTNLILESGKGLKESSVRVDVYFKTGKSNFCLIDDSGKALCQNVLTFKVQPEQGIELLFWSKRAGFENRLEPKKMSFNYDLSKEEIHDAYEQVLYDCILGDQTRFASTKEVRASWNFVASVVKSWQKAPLVKYKKGTNGPKQA